MSSKSVLALFASSAASCRKCMRCLSHLSLSAAGKSGLPLIDLATEEGTPSNMACRKKCLCLVHVRDIGYGHTILVYIGLNKQSGFVPLSTET